MSMQITNLHFVISYHSYYTFLFQIICFYFHNTLKEKNCKTFVSVEKQQVETHLSMGHIGRVSSTRGRGWNGARAPILSVDRNTAISRACSFCRLLHTQGDNVNKLQYNYTLPQLL